MADLKSDQKSIYLSTDSNGDGCLDRFRPNAQKYASWSQRLNVEIYVAYAEANGHATEALSNIRTVKAMSTELQGKRLLDHVRWHTRHFFSAVCGTLNPLQCTVFRTRLGFSSDPAMWSRRTFSLS